MHCSSFLSRCPYAIAVAASMPAPCWIAPLCRRRNRNAPRPSSSAMRARHNRRVLGAGLLTAFALATTAHAAAVPARDYIASIQPSPALQEFLDQTIAALLAADAKLRQTDFRVAVLDLTGPEPPRLAEH